MFRRVMIDSYVFAMYSAILVTITAMVVFLVLCYGSAQNMMVDTLQRLHLVDKQELVKLPSKKDCKLLSTNGHKPVDS